MDPSECRFFLIVLDDVEFHTDSLFQGFTTAAQKLQRKKITNRYQADINKAYSNE